MDFLIEEVGDLRGFLDWVRRIAVVHCDARYAPHSPFGEADRRQFKFRTIISLLGLVVSNLSSEALYTACKIKNGADRAEQGGCL